jgi:hypothetical protein
MYYIPEKLFKDKINIDKVYELLKDTDCDVGSAADLKKYDDALEKIKELGETAVYEFLKAKN